MDESFKQKLRWKVYNKEFKQLNEFEYSCFKFKFNIQSQKLQEQFVELICTDKTLMPWDLGNFFLQNNIKFKIKFRYVKGLGFKGNYVLFKTVKWMQKEQLKIFIKEFISNYKFNIQLNKKEINNKNRINFEFQYMNVKKKTIYCIQADSNIWWKPKRIIKNTNNYDYKSIGWLFVQFAKMKIKEM